MVHPSDVRQACDRCHGKKLRCTRQPESGSCMRCAKANVDCRYSPVARPNRLPQGGESASSSEALNNLGAVWLDDYPTSAKAYCENGATEATQDAHHGLTALPLLMSTLDTIWRGMPPAEACQVSLADMEQYLEYVAGATFIGSVLDQVLSAAQQLQKAYSVATTNAAVASNATNSMGNSHVDYTAMTLLTACHLRLLDILGNVAKHGKLCLEMANAVPPAERPQFLLPQMQMGSFVVPQERMASMIMTMLIDQQRGLVKVAARLGENARDPVSVSHGSLQRMCSVQSTVLAEQAAAVLNDFTEMGDLYADVDLFGSGQ